MKASKEVWISSPFVVTAVNITKLVSAVREAAPNIEFEVECSDSIERKFQTMEELLAYENAPRKEIRKLRIMACSLDYEAKVRFVFLVSPGDNVFFKIDGEEDFVESISVQLDERLAAMKPWYTPVIKQNFVFLLWFFYTMVTLFKIAYWYAEGKIDFSAPTRPFKPSDLLSWNIISGLFPVPLGYALNAFRDRYFPKCVFAIGQGAIRHHNDEYIRTPIAVGFCMSLLAGIVTPLFT